jgi:hypothetical protein
MKDIASYIKSLDISLTLLDKIMVHNEVQQVKELEAK